MCSVEPLREFIRERLTAAAEEICSQLERTIVRFEEEMDRQRRLLDLTWRPRLSLQPADLPHHYGCKEKEIQASQQPCNEETNCSLDQERPEPRQVMKEQEEPEFLQVNIKVEEPELLQIKEEQCETAISQVEELLVLNQQTDTLMMKEGDHGEPEPAFLRHRDCSTAHPQCSQ
ncbi:uncharacterized protein LOC105924506 isoform X3 [Fundulus heteroclitus]|uniref:uncharacterized protein LOC105924506 isoform X3 n=1 Tax=Fundulus heteroclitus TaxID=8078 RepID=UPI00165A70E7|nr:uncharacterized protein LOC105924506 isoform X3 [Fundulus heteroclitus]